MMDSPLITTLSCALLTAQVPREYLSPQNIKLSVFSVSYS